MLSDRWQQIYMGIANKTGDASKDSSNKVGAVLVRPNKRIASLGFNGFPSRIADKPEYLSDPTMRHKKYPRVVHAEANCLDCNPDADTTGYHLVVNMHPCRECALRIVSSGIEYVYYKPQPDFESRWAVSVADARELLEEAGITLVKVEKTLSAEEQHLLDIFSRLSIIGSEIWTGPSNDEIDAALATLVKLLS